MNYIHQIIRLAQSLHFEQIVAGGRFENKAHNISNENPAFEIAEKGDLVMIASEAKTNYCKYGAVEKILNGTSALVRVVYRTFKYVLFNLSPILMTKASSPPNEK